MIWFNVISLFSFGSISLTVCSNLELILVYLFIESVNFGTYLNGLFGFSKS